MSKKQQKKTATENNVITRTEQIHGAVILAYTVLALPILEYFGRTDFFTVNSRLFPGNTLGGIHNCGGQPGPSSCF